jgi:RNA polymerase sigma factor (sigma-70 family)
VTWEDLIDRLEKDIVARQNPDRPGSRDEDAWTMAADLLSRRGRALLRAQLNLIPDEVDDVIQDVLFKLQSLDTMRRVRAARSPEGYLTAMMRNTARDRLRRRRVARDLMIELAGDDPASTAVEIPPLLNDRSRRIRNVVASFTPEDRKLLQMRFWRSMTIQEMAEALDISYSAVAVRLFRVLKKLEKTLGEP